MEGNHPRAGFGPLLVDSVLDGELSPKHLPA